ncbi:MAG: O-antigen ligase family protein [Sphingomonas sp.]|uniref:O-antigen ligase family protein n=1 Tax=Sphingomonas sp. TaxID=28214 RepID=UPI0025EC3525|nr:O-antigen ligase family protein [Sphingomonas sp.]MBX3565286.1 O-antigen ligase family protein [Sphingomonas sp.]
MENIRRPAAHGALGIGGDARATFFALASLLVLVFFMGGGARSDIISLVILRPVAILLLGYGLWTLRWERVRAYRYLFMIAAAMVVVTLLQLVPLPPALWSMLPGHGFIAEIDRAAGLGPVWRPLNVAPPDGWNSFFAMLVPLTFLVLGAQIPTEQRSKLVPVMVVLALVSAVLALLQIVGPPDGPLYFYRVTNSGSAVGLFANRNHQAVLLAATFPLLAVFASMPRNPRDYIARRVLALGAGMFLIPLIFITGSRAGLLVGIVGIASVLLLYRPGVAEAVAPRDAGHGKARRSGGPVGLTRSWRQWAIGGGVAVLGLALSVVTIVLGRGEAFQRILEQDSENETRFKAWTVIVRLVGDYFPFGSGMGSFVEVFETAEPRELLDATYLNHAHNDWLEVLLTGGLAGMALLLFACVLVAVRAFRLLPRGKAVDKPVLFSRLGLVLVLQFAIASLGDYPLRTPALGSLFVLAALWAATPLRGGGDLLTRGKTSRMAK